MNKDQRPRADGVARMPALFIGHGSPMNALEDNEFSQAWTVLGRRLPRPKAVLCISAHWQTKGIQVTAMPHPRTIHDFAGFPQALFEVDYPAPGSPTLAARIQRLIPDIKLDNDWGLDHGCWSILCHMFPSAEFPVLQLSLDLGMSTEQHYLAGRALDSLRDEGVLVIASGNVVHNLRALVWQDVAHDWALAFSEQIKRLITERQDHAILNYLELNDAHLAIPTPEHFLPLLYILGIRGENDKIDFLTDKTTLGAISMLSVRVGA